MIVVCVSVLSSETLNRPPVSLQVVQRRAVLPSVCSYSPKTDADPALITVHLVSACSCLSVHIVGQRYGQMTKSMSRGPLQPHLYRKYNLAFRLYVWSIFQLILEANFEAFPDAGSQQKSVTSAVFERSVKGQSHYSWRWFSLQQIKQGKMCFLSIRDAQYVFCFKQY